MYKKDENQISLEDKSLMITNDNLKEVICSINKPKFKNKEANRLFSEVDYKISGYNNNKKFSNNVFHINSNNKFLNLNKNKENNDKKKSINNLFNDINNYHDKEVNYNKVFTNNTNYIYSNMMINSLRSNESDNYLTPQTKNIKYNRSLMKQDIDMSIINKKQTKDQTSNFDLSKNIQQIKIFPEKKNDSKIDNSKFNEDENLVDSLFYNKNKNFNKEHSNQINFYENENTFDKLNDFKNVERENEKYCHPFGTNPKQNIYINTSSDFSKKKSSSLDCKLNLFYNFILI